MATIISVHKKTRLLDEYVVYSLTPRPCKWCCMPYTYVGGDGRATGTGSPGVADNAVHIAWASACARAEHSCNSFILAAGNAHAAFPGLTCTDRMCHTAGFMVASCRMKMSLHSPSNGSDISSGTNSIAVS